MAQRDWKGRVFIGTSLDGFIARKDGDIKWLTNPLEGKHAKIHPDTHTIGWNNFYPSVDHLVIGRGTYEKVLTFNSWPYTGKNVIVMSTTLEKAEHGISIARSLDEATTQLQQTDAKNVYVDGGKVIQTFLDAKLIDEITIGIAPVILGEGLRLFGATKEDYWLDLVATNASESGMVHATYNVRHSLEA
jgi:dihydrofolate reductase